MQLRRGRTGCGERIDRHGDDAAPEALDPDKSGLQLDELRLARPSAYALIEVEHNLPSTKIAQTNSLARGYRSFEVRSWLAYFWT